MQKELPASRARQLAARPAKPTRGLRGAPALLNECRNSDAAAFAVPPQHFQLGWLGRTEGGPNAGGLWLDQNNKRLRVIGKWGRPWAGDYLNEMGQISGWTTGWTHETCVYAQTEIPGFAPGDPSRFIDYTCSVTVDAIAEPGDSGSPVFSWDGFDGVYMYGMLFAGRVLDGHREFAFSPFDNLEADFGPIRVH